MSAIAVDIPLGVAVLSAWIAALGFARLTSPLDRLHCVSFVTIGSGLPVALAAFVADGPSIRAFKILLMVVIGLVAGSVVTHAVARAMFTRTEAGERS